MEKESFWILHSFGPLFWALFAGFILLLVAASLLLKNRSEKTKKIRAVSAKMESVCQLRVINEKKKSGNH